MIPLTMALNLDHLLDQPVATRNQYTRFSEVFVLRTSIRHISTHSEMLGGAKPSSVERTN